MPLESSRSSKLAFIRGISVAVVIGAIGVRGISATRTVCSSRSVFAGEPEAPPCLGNNRFLSRELWDLGNFSCSAGLSEGEDELCWAWAWAWAWDWAWDWDWAWVKDKAGAL